MSTRARAAATRVIWSWADSGLMSGSRPLAEAYIMSAGTTVLEGRLLPEMKAAMLLATLVWRAPLVGPRW